jgi:hypothetical protein
VVRVDMVARVADASELPPQDCNTSRKGALSPLFCALITHCAGPYCFEFQKCAVLTQKRDMQPNQITEKQGHTMVHAAFRETGSLISVDGTNDP